MNIPTRHGDIWREHERGAYVIVPVNLKGAFKAGVAADALKVSPGACRSYHAHIANGTHAGFVMIAHADRLIFFPTAHTQLDAQASLPLMRVAAGETLYRMRLGGMLAPLTYRLTVPVVSPLLGCGLGNLRWSAVSLVVTPLHDIGVSFIKHSSKS